MDARLLRYYNQELRYLREAGADFAREFPKIAGRLGMEGLEVTDPYVERLLEGCAFLAARVQLKQDAEFPRLSHRLLELLYPNFLAPVPSMLVAQVQPVPGPNLLEGHRLARGTRLLAPASPISSTRCEFQTAQDLVLTPLRVASADHLLHLGELGLGGANLRQRPRAAIRLRLQLPDGLSVSQLRLDDLCLHLAGTPDVAAQLNELLLSACVGVLVGQPGRMPEALPHLLPPEALSPIGYADDEALLPDSPRTLSGVRLLQEYFAFPERFLFLRLSGLAARWPRIEGSVVEVCFLLNRTGQGLDGAVTADNFRLHCVPAINLFSRRADRIALGEGNHEFHVVPERTAPLDYEVYDVLSMSGHGDQGDARPFLPLYATAQRGRSAPPGYYTVWREPRLLSDKARREGPRSGYIGSEVFVALVDPNEAPLPQDLRQLALQVRCTNRDLPVFLSAAGAQNGFTLDAGIPTESVRLVAGPSRPVSALREGGVAWRLINLLSLNYLSLLDADEGEAAAALRDLLSRLPQSGDASIKRQIEALTQVQAEPVVRRHPAPGPIAFGRGIRVSLTVDELGHEGASAFLFGAALHQYLSRHASMNSFVETRLVSLSRGDIMTWRPALGRRPVL